MMKKLIAMVLIAMLLLAGCQTSGGQSDVTNTAAPAAVYDWVAGESPVIPERIGLKRAGVNNADFAIAPKPLVEETYFLNIFLTFSKNS